MVLEKDPKLKMAGKCLKEGEEREEKNCLFKVRKFSVTCIFPNYNFLRKLLGRDFLAKIT